MTDQERISEDVWTELAEWGSHRELNELDAMMWRTERHPENSWTGIVAHMLDETPDWERLRAAHEWFLQMVPRFRERVVDPILPVGTPMWAPDPAFDLDYHLRRIQLPAPGSTRQLLDLAQALALVPMDRARPPWVGTLVEGLEGGRACYLMQAQHVLMDGMAVTQLLTRALGRSREPNANKPWREAAPAGDLTPARVAGHELVRQARSVPRRAGRAVATVGRGLRHPVDSARYAASLRRVLAPPPKNPSMILRGGSRRVWRFGMLECGLAELKAAGKVHGGTLNDTFVCVLLGGLRHYCARFGEDLQDVPISMPVSMRTLDQANAGGNKFAAAFFAVPSGVADPAERIREMHRRVEAVRGERALDFLSTLTPALNRVPSALAAGLVGAMNSGSVLTTSSWPGLGEERFMAGARFERMFVFAPLPGTALTSGMCTHLGTCCIGITVDGEVFKDTDLLWECMRKSLDEVLALGGPSGEAQKSRANAGGASPKRDPASNVG
jgi:WS/DGAT/MGAT family acyltransferase